LDSKVTLSREKGEKMRKLVLYLSLTLGCSSEPCYQNHYQTLKRYPLNFSERTATGIEVDSTGQAADLGKIDRQLNELEACLNKNFAAAPTITLELATKADCRENGSGQKVKFDMLTIRRGCLKVKIPDDWFISRCADEELLPIPADNSICLAKGVMPTAECPCYWRVETQDDNTIVTPPGLKLFKAEVARVITGCNNVWVIPQITACL